jgi:hypothetical protein
MARCTLARRLAAPAPPVSASALPVNCPSCTTVSPPGAQFCASCGNALPREEAGDRYLGAVVARKYRVEKLLGEGGMGRVYRATQLVLEKPVVLKLLHPGLQRDLRTVARFQREAKAASRLSHPNSIDVLDFGQTEDGALFIAMEFVDGARPAPAPHRRLAPSGDPGHPHRRPGALRPGRCPSGQCHPPRPEAGERDGGGPPRWRDRRGEGARLRHRQDHRPQRRGGTVADPDWVRLRNPGVHEPGAGQGRAAGCPERPLLGGNPALPDGDPAAALQLRLGDGLRHQAPHRATQGPQRAQAGGVQPGAGGGHPLGPAQEPQDRPGPRRPSSTR